MGRNRTIYQSEALFVKEMGDHENVGTSDQLLRVQDISHGVELARTDVNEFGQLSAIERQIIEPPTVNLDFSYYVHGGRNEKLLGFTETTDRSAGDKNNLKQAAGNFLKNDSGKNYYISVAKEGVDAKDASGTGIGDLALSGVIGIGNGYVTNYSVEAAVGDMPTASVSVEAANLRFNASGTEIPNPGVDLASGSDLSTPNITNFPAASQTGDKSGDNQVACIKPGDILVDFNDAGNSAPSSGIATAGEVGGAKLEGDGQMHLQNFTIDLPMSRTALTRIGSRHPYSREVEVPLNISFTCSAFLGDIEDGNVNDLLCSSETPRNIRVKMLSNCGTGDVEQEFLLKNCTLESQNFSASIGDNKTVDLVFTTQMGGATDTDSGLYMFMAGQNHSFGASEAKENPADLS